MSLLGHRREDIAPRPFRALIPSPRCPSPENCSSHPQHNSNSELAHVRVSAPRKNGGCNTPLRALALQQVGGEGRRHYMSRAEQSDASSWFRLVTVRREIVRTPEEEEFLFRFYALGSLLSATSRYLPPIRRSTCVKF